jgi:hypothetical protein
VCRQRTSATTDEPGEESSDNADSDTDHSGATQTDLRKYEAMATVDRRRQNQAAAATIWIKITCLTLALIPLVRK